MSKGKVISIGALDRIFLYCDILNFSVPLRYKYDTIFTRINKKELWILFMLRQDGKTFGPFSPVEISDLIQNGAISRQAEASPMGSEDWHPLSHWSLGHSPEPPVATSSQYVPFEPAPPNNRPTANAWSPPVQPTEAYVPQSPPVGVVVIGVLHALGALGMLLGMIGAFIVPRWFSSIPAAPGGNTAMVSPLISGIVVFLAILFLAFLFLFSFVAYGMFTLRNSARITAVVLSTISLLGQLRACAFVNGPTATFSMTMILIQSAVAIWIMVYLSQPRIKSYFS